MAIYGCGANYNGQDMSLDFIENECVCVGYENEEAPAIYEILRRAKIGDIVYLKSFSPKGSLLTIKAIGIFDYMDREINSESLIEYPNKLGHGRKVKWLVLNEQIKISLSPQDYTYNVYSNTLYEEYSERIAEEILEVLYSHFEKG